jgi:hypothetical protein
MPTTSNIPSRPKLLEPGPIAGRSIAIAAETGWSEEFIYIWLPLQRAEQYYHALLRRASWRTYLPPPPAQVQREQIEAEWGAAEFFTPRTDIDEVWQRFVQQQ